MKAESDGALLETRIQGDGFLISITEESDLSMDGGYTFEQTTNCFSLSRESALILAKELRNFLNEHYE